MLGLGVGGTVSDVTTGEAMHFNLDFGEFASHAKFVAIDDATSAYIEPVEAEISLLDMHTGNCTRTPLNNPEVFRIKSDYRATGSGLSGHATGIVVMDATSSNGVVYCALTGFKKEDGLPIVVVEPRTSRTTLLRAPLNGRDFPASIAVNAGRLYLLTTTGIVSVYTLPQRYP